MTIAARFRRMTHWRLFPNASCPDVSNFNFGEYGNILCKAGIQAGGGNMLGVFAFYISVSKINFP